jgi:hypothetical protein
MKPSKNYTKEEYEEILDRIEKKYGDEFDDLQLKSWLEEGNRGRGDNGKLGDKLFIIHMKRYEDKVEDDLEERRVISVSSYGTKRSYKRTIPMSWTDEQEKVIKENMKTKTTKQIIYEYNRTFSPLNQGRTESSIKTKIYRLR